MRHQDERGLAILSAGSHRVDYLMFPQLLEEDAQHTLEMLLGDEEATQVRAAFELGRRFGTRSLEPHGESLGSPEHVHAWAKGKLVGLPHEELWALGVDAKNRLRSARMVAKGGVLGCVVSPRDILREVLREGSPGFILVHNHPSGDPLPSSEDITFTHRVAAAAQVVGAAFLDHVVVAREGFTSLAHEI